jgi:hypothetical protein
LKKPIIRRDGNTTYDQAYDEEEKIPNLGLAAREAARAEQGKFRGSKSQQR